MKDKLEVVRGSGNVFRDLGHENADAEQCKAILAAEIIKALDRERLTVRAAHDRTGFAAADFSLLYPLIVVYPDWEANPGQAAQRLLVQSILSPQPRFPEPREKGLRIVEIPALTVAAYAYRGPYTLDRFQKALTAIHSYLKAKNIPATGPPRHLYYSNVDWSLGWWRLSEVQVPIPNQSRPD